MKKIRNPFAIDALSRRAPVFKDKRLKRIKNKEDKDIKESKEEAKDEQEDSSLYNSDYNDS